MANFGGRGIVVVIRAIEVGHRRIDELIDIDVVKAIDARGMELAAEPGILSPTEGANSAVFAKDMMDTVRLIVDQVSFACGKAEGVRPDDGALQPRHRAHRAVAFKRPRAQVEIRLEANCTAISQAAAVPFIP